MIHHVAITSMFPERLSDFYQGLPGIVKIRENLENSVLRSVWFGFQGSDSILMIERGESRSPHALVFDLRRLFSFSLDRNKVSVDMRYVISLIESKTEYTFYFRDPDGNQLGYSAYPEKLSEYPLDL